ncbi:uncharacterized protein LOC135818451 [Sycon ciliatum]|uniref:uncharacterized protein LOC135818451 n=1 Tax=Sycon ciliatum TaxID=27933 RepID=UPI0031F6DFFB
MLALLLFTVLAITCSCFGQLSVDVPSPDQYNILLNGKPLLLGSGVAVFHEQQWFASDATNETSHNDSVDESPAKKLVLVKKEQKSGVDVIGSYSSWDSTWQADDVTIVTVIKTYPSLENVVAFSYNISNSSLTPGTNSGDANNVITNFPALSKANGSFFDNSTFLGWSGMMVRAVMGYPAYGKISGPHVYVDGEAPVNSADVVILSYFDHFMSSSQTNQRYNGEKVDWIPGISQSVKSLPAGFSHTFVVFHGTRGLTQTMHDYGQFMQSTHSPTGKLERHQDITLDFLGYQTDNGAMYCFCYEGSGCVKTLLDLKAYLDSIEVPLGYLSHQGEWWKSSFSSPWCVTDWTPNAAYAGMSVADFRQKFGTPLQLYAPFFCNDTVYARDNGGNFSMINSSSALPRCGNYHFRLVAPNSSAEFYNEFFKLGKSMGMESFEIDFMNQNYICVPDLIESVAAVEMWMDGLHQAALQQQIPMQWCMTTPTHALASLYYPTVTNFRASVDYKGGTSYHIGLSSILIWAVGAAPSKDTFWTTDNMPLATQTGGCSTSGCPVDHSNASLELHTILAVLSTGPVGFSDAVGMTNRSLLMRTCQENGRLLQPAKAVTSIDAIMSKTRQFHGNIYSTYCGNESRALAYLVVSFSMRNSWNLTTADLWSPSGIVLPAARQASSNLLVYRLRWNDPPCLDGKQASECVKSVSMRGISENDVLCTIPAIPGPDIVPCLTTVWPIVCANGWLLLGELTKYVPLAASRFPAMYSCTADGLVATVLGSAKEVVSVTALGPQNGVAASIVYVKHITIGAAASATIHFP